VKLALTLAADPFWPGGNQRRPVGNCPKSVGNQLHRAKIHRAKTFLEFNLYKMDIYEVLEKG
jgi:hypothetical protein